MEAEGLLDRAKQIRDEIKDGANTAERVGGLMVDMIVYFQKDKGEYVVISPSNIQSTYEPSSHIINIKSNTRWFFNIIEGEEFVSSDDNTQGVGNESITFNVAENTTKEQRIAKVRFFTETEVEANLVINQEGIATPSVSIDQDTLSVIRQGGNYTIHVSANTDWQIDYHPSWVILSQENGGAGEFDITVTVSPNTTSAAREDDIGFVTLVEGGEGGNCLVTQTAEGDYLVLSPSIISAKAAQGNYNITVDSTDSWEQISRPDWAALSLAGGGAGSTEIGVTCVANAIESPRTGKIVLALANNNEVTAELTINQAGEISTPYVRPTSNYVLFNTNNEDSQLLELDTNVGIDDITSAPLSGSWCNCSIQESDGKIYLKIDVNYSSENDPRIGLISLLLSNGATEAHIISIGQMGAYNNVITYGSLIYIGPIPTIVSENAIPRSYTQMRYYIICDNSWVVTDQASFAQMDTSAGGADGEPTMTEVFLTVNANDGTTDRVGDIVMMDSDSNEVTMSLTQEVDGLWIGLSGGDFRPITNAKQHVTIICPSNLSESQIADVSYEILDNGDDWIGFTNNNITGSQFSYIFTVQANATGATRIARILIKYADINPIVITISQQA